MTTPDRAQRTIRLRASCNACNEAKVRCSQHKPTCARCERLSTRCVYGLSRRTHKDAPPIMMPQSQRASRSSSNAEASKGADKTHSRTKSAGSTPPYGSASPSNRSTVTHAPETNMFNDYLSMLQPHASLHHTPEQMSTVSESGVHHDLLSEFTATGMLDPLSAPITRPPSPSSRFPTHSWGGPGTFFGNNTGSATSDDSSGSDMALFTITAAQMTPCGGMAAATTGSTGSTSVDSSGDECNCHDRVTELLASIRSGSDDYRHLFFDARLVKLKQCISSSEMSIGCTHSRDDSEPLHIMAVATLIAFVLTEFEMLANEPPLRRSSPMSEAMILDTVEGPNDSISAPRRPSTATFAGQQATTGPRLSWGVLQLEDEDEVDLRRRLYLLSFRKLERLLRQLTICLRKLQDSQASYPRLMGFVMACDYTRLWLEKKAADVKVLFSSISQDEPADSSLS